MQNAKAFQILKSTQQQSHPSHSTDKQTKAPTVEFVQCLGTLDLSDSEMGLGVLLVEDHSFSPDIHTCEYVCGSFRNL